MAGKSKIEWTEATWNPIVGCSILTPGCTNCYAMKMAARIEAMKRSHYDGTTRKVNGNAVWTGKLALAPEHILDAPLRRRKPTTYFVNSMGDLFHERIPDQWIDLVFDRMRDSPQHIFQVLTKRAERMREYVTDRFEREAGRAADNQILHPWPVPVLPNVWLGVSAERQQEADARIPSLLQTPAAVRFISAEPLLGPIDLTNLGDLTFDLNAFTGLATHRLGMRDQTVGKLDWVIVGGESGPGARPMHPDWARSIRDQCADAGVPLFFKQWGAWVPDVGPGDDGNDPIFEGKGPCAKFVDGRWQQSENGFTMPLNDGDREWVYRVGKKAAGRLLDGIEHNAMPSLASALAAPQNKIAQAHPASAEAMAGKP